jgi:hypothetical protein
MASGNGKKKDDIEAVISKLKALHVAYILATKDEYFSGGAPPGVMIEMAWDVIVQMVTQYGDVLERSQISVIGNDVRKLAQIIHEREQKNK